MWVCYWSRQEKSFEIQDSIPYIKRGFHKLLDKEEKHINTTHTLSFPFILKIYNRSIEI